MTLSIPAPTETKAPLAPLRRYTPGEPTVNPAGGGYLTPGCLDRGTDPWTRENDIEYGGMGGGGGDKKNYLLKKKTFNKNSG